MRIEFNASDSASLGVEVELQFVDRATRELRSCAVDLLGELDAATRTKAKHELLQCTVELNTAVCKDVGEARRDLEVTLREVTAAADRQGVAAICSGTHPFSRWTDQQISPDPRYAALLERMQWPARRLQIFGIHYHVGVRSAAKAIAIANALCAYIPHFLALSASSPFWEGQDTGLASARSKVFEGLPTAGLPHQLGDWEEFERFMETLRNAGAIDSIRDVWWDIRPHPGFGTVEVRVCDGLPTLREVSALAAFAQSLVAWMDGLIDRGYSLPVVRPWIVQRNKWLAARYGTAAEMISDDQGNKTLLRHSIENVVSELEPTARKLGCEDELAVIWDVLDRGPSYIRQRDVIEAGGSQVDVVDSLIGEWTSDAFS